MGTFFDVKKAKNIGYFIWRFEMHEITLCKINEALTNLLPDDDIDIRSATDLRNNPNPAIQDLCEAAELIIRLSKEERV